jgi:hypothetical protein
MAARGAHSTQEEKTMTIDRRSLLQAGLTSAAVGSVSIAAAGTAAAQSTSKTYVLVHGAWHGGWCWKEVADGLRGMGHRVTTPTQTGLGERKHLLSKDIINKTSQSLPSARCLKIFDDGHSTGTDHRSTVCDRNPQKMDDAVKGITH